MGYIGKIPSAVPLTSADITDNVITSAKIVDSTIVNADIANSTIDLTTKVTGVLPIANGGTNLSSGFFNGIKEADQFRLSSNFTYTGSQAAQVLSSNWERVDTNSFDKIGTGMTQSSGVFTFPSTGIYLVSFGFHGEGSNTNNNRFVIGGIDTTTDGTNFDPAGDVGTNILGNTNNNDTRGSGFFMHQFDVTNVSTHKVRFWVACNNNNVIFFGNTGDSYTYVNFIRLGDT